jgi:hypothetical protein
MERLIKYLLESMHRVILACVGRLRQCPGPRKNHPMGNFELPDVRDGLTRKERVVLYVLHQAQKERGDRNVPTAMLCGRVCEYFYISPEELSEMLARLGARRF